MVKPYEDAHSFFTLLLTTQDLNKIRKIPPLDVTK